jgi:hypothetical protein
LITRKFVNCGTIVSVVHSSQSPKIFDFGSINSGKSQLNGICVGISRVDEINIVFGNVVVFFSPRRFQGLNDVDRARSGGSSGGDVIAGRRNSSNGVVVDPVASSVQDSSLVHKVVDDVSSSSGSGEEGETTLRENQLTLGSTLASSRNLGRGKISTIGGIDSSHSQLFFVSNEGSIIDGISLSFPEDNVINSVLNFSFFDPFPGFGSAVISNFVVRAEGRSLVEGEGGSRASFWGHSTSQNSYGGVILELLEGQIFGVLVSIVVGNIPGVGEFSFGKGNVEGGSDLSSALVNRWVKSKDGSISLGKFPIDVVIFSELGGRDFKSRVRKRTQKGSVNVAVFVTLAGGNPRHGNNDSLVVGDFEFVNGFFSLFQIIVNKSGIFNCVGSCLIPSVSSNQVRVLEGKVVGSGFSCLVTVDGGSAHVLNVSMDRCKEKCSQ